MPENHTPGPWTYSTDNSGDRHIRAADGDSMMCDASYYPWAPDNKADWPLIAAAPEMLAELRRYYEKYGEQSTADIIAKATGE